MKKLNAYQKLALRTAKGQPGKRIDEAALGLAGEAGEVADLVKKYRHHGHDLDVDAMRLELGDVLWYIASMADAVGLRLEEVAAANIAKLEARYPDGFDEARSKFRPRAQGQTANPLKTHVEELARLLERRTEERDIAARMALEYEDRVVELEAQARDALDRVEPAGLIRNAPCDTKLELRLGDDVAAYAEHIIGPEGTPLIYVSAELDDWPAPPGAKVTAQQARDIAAMFMISADALDARASTFGLDVLHDVRVPYYSNPRVPLNQIAALKVVDADTLTATPWERDAIGPICKAIESQAQGVTVDVREGVVFVTRALRVGGKR